MKVLPRFVLCFLVLCVATDTASAVTIEQSVMVTTTLIETPGPFDDDDPWPNGIHNAVLARVDVGGDDVAIRQISVHGRVDAALTMKWVVFEGIADGTAPVFETSPMAFGPSGPDFGWFDSPVFSPLVLSANTTYWIGPAIDGPSSAFRQTYNDPGTSVSANGLTLAAGDNGITTGSFAAPTLNASAGGTQSTIVLAVPEPSALTLAAFGTLGLLAFQRRRHWILAYLPTFLTSISLNGCVPMKTLSRSVLCLLVLCFATAASAVTIDPSPVTGDLWDVRQGSTVTGGSPTEFYSLTTNMFGGDSWDLYPGHGEYLNTIFRDWSSGEQLHFVEWRTPNPITLKSFVLNAKHDPSPRDIFWRGFSRFSLYGYNEQTNQFDIELFQLMPASTFGDTPSPSFAVVNTNDQRNRLSLAANLSTVLTTNRFRAEFVTPGDPGSDYLSPRIEELDGFDTYYPGVPIPEPSTLALTVLGLFGLIGFSCRRASIV